VHLLSFVFQVQSIAYLLSADHIYYVSLKIRVNQHIIKLNGKNIVCVCSWDFYNDSVFNLRCIMYAKLAKKLYTIVNTTQIMFIPLSFIVSIHTSF